MNTGAGVHAEPIRQDTTQGMRILRTWRASVGAAALLATFFASTAVPAHGAGLPAGERSVTLHQAVADLPVADENRSGYDREREFGGWVDADHDGCNTRAEVLLDEAVSTPDVTGRCTITPDTGTWWSWYDDTTVTSARGLDIDHRGPQPR